MGDARGLAKAKARVERSFPVVGVIELINQTLQVAEDRLPGFFRGARDIYWAPEFNQGNTARITLSLYLH